MSTIKKLMAGLEKKYKVYTALSPLTMIGEVVMETVIPLLMAKIIDVGIRNNDIAYVVRMGIIMIGAACLSLACGAFGARFAAVASLGFSRNLRRRLFAKVQDYSFGNVDHFSTASLVTRLTTDVTNTQNTYQMIVRMCVRAPFMGNLSHVQYAIISICGAFLVIGGTMDLGSIAAFLQYTRSFSRPITMMSQQFNGILNALAGAERIFAVIDESPEVDDGIVTLVNATETTPSASKDNQVHLVQSFAGTGEWACITFTMNTLTVRHLMALHGLKLQPPARRHCSAILLLR